MSQFCSVKKAIFDALNGFFCMVGTFREAVGLFGATTGATILGLSAAGNSGEAASVPACCFAEAGAF